MMIRRLVKYAVALLLVAVFLVGSIPAHAAPPARITIPLAGSFVLAQCDGFNVVDEYHGMLAITEFYDQDGELVRLGVQGLAHDRVYNSVTGFSVGSTYAVNQTYYPDTGELKIRGLAFNIIVPGYGMVYFDSGLGVYYVVNGSYILVKFAGNYQADTAALCEAMDQ
jgi:hypothetical protein